MAWKLLRYGLVLIAFGLLAPASIEASSRPVSVIPPQLPGLESPIPHCGHRKYKCITLTADEPIEVDFRIPCYAECDYTFWYAWSYVRTKTGLQMTNDIDSSVYSPAPGGGSFEEVSTGLTQKSSNNRYLSVVEGCNTESSPTECYTFKIGVTIAASTNAKIPSRAQRHVFFTQER